MAREQGLGGTIARLDKISFGVGCLQGKPGSRYRGEVGVSAYLPEHYPEREGGRGEDGDEVVMSRGGLGCCCAGWLYLGRLPYQNLLALCSSVFIRI